VFVDGIDLFRQTSAQRARFRSRRVGFVFQAYHLLGEMTALENVCLAGRIGRRNGREVFAKGLDALAAVGLSQRLNHRPAELSGGEQQRVAIARALVNEPELLLADEPTGNLDSKTGETIIRLLLDLQRQRGMTLIIVTHDHNIGRHAQRVLEIADGRIIHESKGTA
jgi:predicted ABC-type transport system involved in lysophospholipase L1 biosynthesis ATPase subunit